MKELIDFGLLILIYFLVFYKKWKAKGKYMLFMNTTMYVYLSFVIYFTLMPIVTSLPNIFNHHCKSMNLVPFIDVSMHRGDFTRQIVLNVIMTIPFGFLLPFLEKKATLLRVDYYTFLLSLSIEILQPFLNSFRASDITDIITNVSGGIIGYILYLICKPLMINIRNYLKNR